MVHFLAHLAPIGQEPLLAAAVWLFAYLYALDTAVKIMRGPRFK